MGVLWSPEKQRGWALGPRNLVGRGPECVVQLDDPLASSSHALLTWRGEGWLLRDLGSRNGTLLDGRRVEPGQPVSLSQGARIRFGGTEDLVLRGAGGPGPVALDRSGDRVVDADGGLLVLPPDAEPQALVYEDGEGSWLLEQDGEAEEIASGCRLVLDGSLWTVLLPSAVQGGPVPTTMALSAAKDVGTMGLHFRVSQDEEHVDVEVSTGGRRIPLRSRVHHFLLLQLARTRLQDRDAGVAEAEQGWAYVDELCRQLDVEPPVMNVQMLRARKQLAKAGVEGAGQLFERRRLSGQLRLAVRSLEVQKP